MSVDSPNLLSTMFAALVSRTDLLMILMDRAGRIEWVNPAFVERIGSAVEVLIGQKLLSILGANSQVNTQQAYLREQLLKGESFKFELFYISPTQSEYWLLIDGQPICNEEGIATKYAVLATDITLRKRTEHDLEQTRLRLKRLVESAKLVPWEACALTHQFTYVGPQATQLFGYGIARWYESNFWQNHIHPEDLPKILCSHQDKSLDKDNYVVEYRLLTAEGLWVWVKDIVTVVRNKGEVTQLLGFLIDISERKHAELSLQKALTALETANEELESRVHHRTADLSREKEKLEQALQQLQQAQTQLIQSEKMSSLGQLVAGVAHEINNPITFIYGNLGHTQEYINKLLQLIQAYQQHYPIPNTQVAKVIEEIELDFLIDDLPKLLTSMQNGANRIRNIIVSLRNFSRLDEAKLKAVDIHEGIDSTLMILHRHFAEIQVIKNYGNLPQIECYPSELNQVFMNILLNAAEVFQKQEIKFLQKKIYSPTICITTEVIDTAWVQIRIQDNGPGIEESVKQCIFDPFFTTKAIGQGTGLGLYISYQIVTQTHQGVLECISQAGEGAEFIIKLPIRIEPLPLPAP